MGMVAVVGVVAPGSRAACEIELAEEVRKLDGLRGPMGGRAVGEETLARLEVEAEGPGPTLTAEPVPLKVEVEPEREGCM